MSNYKKVLSLTAIAAFAFQPVIAEEGFFSTVTSGIRNNKGSLIVSGVVGTGTAIATYISLENSENPAIRELADKTLDSTPKKVAAAIGAGVVASVLTYGGCKGAFLLKGKFFPSLDKLNAQLTEERTKLTAEQTKNADLAQKLRVADQAVIDAAEAEKAAKKSEAETAKKLKEDNDKVVLAREKTIKELAEKISEMEKAAADKAAQAENKKTAGNEQL